jgi:glycosyltransferase involved in cell wall biosynthesis
MNIRSRILRCLYRTFPFSLKGDLSSVQDNSEYDISCVINFYGRPELLEGILYSLKEQDLPKDRFEVVMVEDRGGTPDGRRTVQRFKDSLNIHYSVLTEKYGHMGYSRNVGISESKGRYILFLDDDTVILQKDFLRKIIEEFENSGADGVVPFGSASFCLWRERYDYHDPRYPSNRCMAYRREALLELGGFVSDIIGQEDVEFVIRFLASGKKFFYSEYLRYLHPPLLMNNLNKAKAVGISFARLRKRYPLVVWLMLLINGARYLPLIVFPFKKKWWMQGRFSLGFLIGVIYSFTGKKIQYS